MSARPDWDALLKNFHTLMARNVPELNDGRTLLELYDEFTELTNERNLINDEGQPWPDIPTSFAEMVPFFHINQDMVRMKLERIGKTVPTAAPNPIKPKGKRKADYDMEPDAMKHRRLSPASANNATSPSSPGSSCTSVNVLDSIPSLTRGSRHNVNTPPQVFSPPGPPISTCLTDLLYERTAKLRDLQREYNESTRRLEMAHARHAKVAKAMADAKQQVKETACMLMNEGTEDEQA